MNEQLYSLQGIIFQKGHTFGTAHKPGVGIAVTMQEAVNYSMFHAVVSTDEYEPQTLSGHMSDRWGQSTITEFIMNENGISFKKEYGGRPPIRYSFREKKDDIWYGTYTGPDCGTGTTKLIVTPINELFFTPVDEE